MENDKMSDYIDKDGKVHEHIHLINFDHLVFLRGWYFIDKTYDWHGPFKSLKECEDIFKKYCDKYLSENTHEVIFLFSVIDDPFKETSIKVSYDKTSEDIIFDKNGQKVEFYIKEVSKIIAHQKYPDYYPECKTMYSEELTRIFERAIREIR